MKRAILLLTALFLLIPAAGCAEDPPYIREIFAMDTVMRLTAYGPQGQEAVDAAVEEIYRLDALLSASSPSSEVSRLNEAGGGPLTKDTASLLRSSLSVWEATGGLFECTIYPLMELWGFSTGEYRVPSQEELQAALPLADSSLLRLQGDSLAVAPGQRLDFGGIAKGYAAGRVMEIFSAHGVRSGLVSLGGSIQTLGTKPDGSLWRIGIQDPDAARETFLAVLEVRDLAVVTSGGYERFFEQDGETYIHILDPRTGRPAESDLLSVTVLSPDGVLADALSTALFIMGREEALAFWRESSLEFQLVLLTEDRELYVTEGAAGVETELPLTVADRR